MILLICPTINPIHQQGIKPGRTTGAIPVGIAAFGTNVVILVLGLVASGSILAGLVGGRGGWCSSRLDRRI